MLRSLRRVSAVAALLGACGGDAAERQPVARASAALPEEPAAPASAEPQAAPLVGTWDLVNDPPSGEPTAGIRMTLALDSVRSGAVHGRVTWYFAGDVGVDPARFRPVVGRLTGNTAVSLQTGPRDAAEPTYRFEGVLAGDTIALGLFAIGGDTLSGGERRWLLVRGR